MPTRASLPLREDAREFYDTSASGVGCVATSHDALLAARDGKGDNTTDKKKVTKGKPKPMTKTRKQIARKGHKSWVGVPSRPALLLDLPKQLPDLPDRLDVPRDPPARTPAGPAEPG